MNRICCILLIFIASTATAATVLEQKLEAAGYVDVRSAVPRAFVSLMYARPDNFTGRVLYDSLSLAYLHPDAARALAKADAALQREAPNLRLMVKDAARPVSVQRSMFTAVRGTRQAPYVANPANGGGTHNFGVAVDITLCDSLGHELDMGTPVDHLGPESHINEDALLRSGALTPLQAGRRRLLRRIMLAGGFKTIRKEWWHFELERRPQAARRYRLIDF